MPTIMGLFFPSFLPSFRPTITDAPFSESAAAASVRRACDRAATHFLIPQSLPLQQIDLLSLFPWNERALYRLSFSPPLTYFHPRSRPCCLGRFLSLLLLLLFASPPPPPPPSDWMPICAPLNGGGCSLVPRPRSVAVAVVLCRGDGSASNHPSSSVRSATEKRGGGRRYTTIPSRQPVDRPYA